MSDAGGMLSVDSSGERFARCVQTSSNRPPVAAGTLAAHATKTPRLSISSTSKIRGQRHKANRTIDVRGLTEPRSSKARGVRALIKL